MTSKLPSHMHPCSQQLNYNPSSYHLHASFMAKFILCGRTHTLSYIPYCASCYFSGFLTDIYTPIHTPARPHNVLHSSSSCCLIAQHSGHGQVVHWAISLGRAKRSPSLLGGAKPEAMVRRNRMVWPSKPDGTAVETGWYGRRNRMVRPYVGEGPTTCT